MKYIILSFFFFLPAISVHAQRMIIENGGIYIESFGVRSDLVVPSPALKRVTLGDGSVRTAYHQGVASPQNILISRKFQVAKKDAPPQSHKNFYVQSGFAVGKDGRPGAPMEIDPGNTTAGCDNYSEQADGSDKGQWRVPTINEYVLMGCYFTDYSVKITGVDGFVLPATQSVYYEFQYATSTTYEGSVDRVYIFRFYPAFYSPMTTNELKTYPTRVRCIRDVE